jgi:hypothetical protein
MHDRSKMLMSAKSRYRCISSKSMCSAIAIIVFISYINCCCTGKNDLIILSNDNIEVGILPEVGGRVVLLRKPGMRNILKSDERLWHDPDRYKPEISAFSDFKAFYGHIVWVSPQSEWWIHQDINEIRRNKKADWPPDPYLIYTSYEIISKGNAYIKMVSPASPVSGVRLFKEISIDSSGIVTFTVSAENIRKESVSWDLWMNTRLDGFARGYVPIEKNGIQEFIKSENKTREVTPWKIENEYFTFCPSQPDKPKTVQVQEVHLRPSTGFIAGFSKRQVLVIRFEKLDQNLIHPEHGQVELYNYVNETGKDPLLELEVHGAYCTLAPAEIMSLTETWEIRSYHGKTNARDHTSFLQHYLKGRF